MQYQVLHGPVFSVLEIQLAQSEQVTAQPNSMISMTSGLQLSASVAHQGSKPSWWQGAKNVLGGESVFMAMYFAKRDEQTLVLAPSVAGDVLPIQLMGSNGFYLTRGSFLASIGDCQLSIKYGGMKGVMSKKGLFLLHVTGEGTVFCQTYGAIMERDLAEGEHFFLDNRYAVAFSETVQYQLVKATDSVKDSIMSGEGLINRYTGPGKLYYQTRAKPTASVLSYFFNSPF